ncbi:hypothetical protein [Flexithrix dorotheae]|uniref:hypothetical protein n=1 Tax=Flexithrix dorotheae TaxID=70993 RepID=UPI0003702352|nr:hypothetical protein [Flexithrix dorotheae]
MEELFESFKTDKGQKYLFENYPLKIRLPNNVSAFYFSTDLLTQIKHYLTDENLIKKPKVLDKRIYLINSKYLVFYMNIFGDRGLLFENEKEMNFSLFELPIAAEISDNHKITPFYLTIDSNEIKKIIFKPTSIKDKIWKGTGFDVYKLDDGKILAIYSLDSGLIFSDLNNFKKYYLNFKYGEDFL